jgi:acetylornithine deacetylase/succinyl-diaminopimelate desuccinylase-like protein
MPAIEFRRIAEQHQEEIVGLARDLVRIDTTNTGVMPTGGETAAAEFLKGTLHNERIDAEILGRVPERGNLFAALDGPSKQTCLVLASHMDVVPAGDEAQWTHPPFAGTVEGGYLHGRGSSDMKGTVAAQVMALMLLRRLRVPLAHSVGLVCVADEEAGGSYGMGWAAQAHPERLRARYCVNEGGGTFATVDGASWCLLGVGEKGRFEVQATFHGRGAHAAQPWQGDNALFRATRALERLQAYEPERDTSDPIFPYLRRTVGPITSATVDDVIERLGAGARELADHCRQVSRMLVTPTMISGGVKSNSVPDACRLTCDVRALPHHGPAYVDAKIRSLLPGADVRIECTAVANASPADAGWLDLLSDVLTQVLERSVEVVPTLSGGFTDSRFVRELGVPTYGFAPLHPESDRSRRHVHGPNESVAIADLVVQTSAYLTLAHRLAAA